MGAIGSPLGWLALITMGSAWALGHYQHRSLPIRDAGVFGLAAIVLLACQIEVHWPGFGYQTLMLGWAAYPLAWVLFLAASARLRVPASLFLDAADYWVRLAGTLGTVLALNAAIGRGIICGRRSPSASLVQQRLSWPSGVGTKSGPWPPDGQSTSPPR